MTTFRLLSCSALILAGTLTSCIKEDECLQREIVRVAVQDKVYDNATDGSVGEALPLSSYVSSLNVSYRSVGEGGTPFLEQSLSNLGTEQTVTLPTQELSAGRYEITVTGNAKPENFIVDPDYPIELHPQGEESGDIYIGRDTVDLYPAHEHTIYLQRTKGKLQLAYTNLPADVKRIELSVDGIQKNVNSNLEYSGTTQATKTFLLPDGSTSGNLDFFLSPSLANTPAKLQIRLFDADGNTIRIMYGIDLNVMRNKISMLEIKYDQTANIWELWINIEGEWVKFHNLIIM